MSAIARFARGTWFQYRAMFNWASPIGYLSYKLLLPIGQILFFTQLGVFGGGRERALYFALGNALQLTAINGIYGVVMTVGNERQFGTLPILLGSPANRLVTFLSRACVHLIDGMTGVLVGLLLATAIYHLDLGRANLPLLAFCIVLISVSTCGLGLLLGSVGLVMRDVLTIGNVVYYLTLVICGINFPVSSLPGWVQTISWLMPLTRGVEAAREASTGAGLGHVGGLLAGEVAVGALYGIAGYALFRMLEERSRRGGLLEAY